MFCNLHKGITNKCTKIVSKNLQTHMNHDDWGYIFDFQITQNSILKFLKMTDSMLPFIWQFLIHILLFHKLEQREIHQVINSNYPAISDGNKTIHTHLNSHSMMLLSLKSKVQKYYTLHHIVESNSTWPLALMAFLRIHLSPLRCSFILWPRLN